jgi:hypothetical protein
VRDMVKASLKSQLASKLLKMDDERFNTEPRRSDAERVEKSGSGQRDADLVAGVASSEIRNSMMA